MASNTKSLVVLGVYCGTEVQGAWVQEACLGVRVGGSSVHRLARMSLPLPCSGPAVPSHSFLLRLTCWLPAHRAEEQYAGSLCAPALGLQGYQVLPVCAPQGSGTNCLASALYRPGMSTEFVLTFTLLRQ